MSMSRRSVDTLIDLIENKMSTMLVFDREDARELATLEHARRELITLRGARNGQVVPMNPPAMYRAVGSISA